MNRKTVFTCNEHEQSVGEVFSSPVAHGAHRLVASENSSGGFLGFGVAITPSSCYVLSKMSKDERKDLFSHLYSKDGVNLGIARLCIGSSDYSPEIYSYDDVPFDTELSHFSVSRDGEYIIPIIKEILEINPDLYILASPWSPPGWMKTGGSIYGGYMRDEYVDCYADYFVKYIKAYAAHGIKIAAVTPQNECNTQQNYKMPACIWHPETEARFIIALKQKLEKNSLYTKIWMLDHNFSDVPRVTWMLDNCEGLYECCDGVAFHYYSGAIEQTAVIREKYPRLSLYFTEGGPRLCDNYDTDWCKWALMMVKALKAGYRSFIGWNLMLDEQGGPNVGPFLGQCAGLVTRDSRDGALSYSGQYKAFCHIASLVTPNSKIYPLSVGASFNLAMSAFPKSNIDIEGVIIENDGKQNAVIVNPNAAGFQVQLELDGKLWYLELQPNSITTL